MRSQRIVQDKFKITVFESWGWWVKTVSSWNSFLTINFGQQGPPLLHHFLLRFSFLSNALKLVWRCFSHKFNHRLKLWLLDEICISWSRPVCSVFQLFYFRQPAIWRTTQNCRTTQHLFCRKRGVDSRQASQPIIPLKRRNVLKKPRWPVMDKTEGLDDEVLSCENINLLQMLSASLRPSLSGPKRPLNTFIWRECFKDLWRRSIPKCLSSSFCLDVVIPK